MPDTMALQPPRIWRIGYLSPQSRLDPPYDRAFLQGVRERGYVEGRNLNIGWRFADGVYERLLALAAELARHRVRLQLGGAFKHVVTPGPRRSAHRVVQVSRAGPDAISSTVASAHP